MTKYFIDVQHNRPATMIVSWFIIAYFATSLLEENPELSRMTLTSGIFEFSWLLKIVKLVPHQIIQFESVDGLPNKGAIRFYPRGDRRTIIKLTVAYAIPGILGKIMDNLLIGRIVESTIQADLNRFRDYALQAYQCQFDI